MIAQFAVPASAAYIILIGLCILTIVAFVHARAKRDRGEDLAASNARILREYKRMARHQPEKIVETNL